MMYEWVIYIVITPYFLQVLHIRSIIHIFLRGHACLATSDKTFCNVPLHLHEDLQLSLNHLFVCEHTSVPLFLWHISPLSTPLITAVSDHRQESSSLLAVGSWNTSAHLCLQIELLPPYNQQLQHLVNPHCLRERKTEKTFIIYQIIIILKWSSCQSKFMYSSNTHIDGNVTDDIDWYTLCR